MTSVLKIPKVQMSFLLLVLFVSTFFGYASISFVPLLVRSILSAVIIDMCFVYIRHRKFIPPYAAFVTGLIIALIIDPQASWYYIMFVNVIAIGSKNFLRIDGRHIFNPAAIGLLVGVVLFKQQLSWWGVSFQHIVFRLSLQSLLLFITLLLPFLVSAYRLKRYITIITFISFYALFTSLSVRAFSLQSYFLRFIDPTVIFFSGVMLIEPMTSPVTHRSQLVFGLFVAGMTAILSLAPVNNFINSFLFLPDVFIPSLVMGNIIFFRKR